MRQTCERGCCEWAEDGAVIRYTPHSAFFTPPQGETCRYCEDDATGRDFLGRWACKRHIEEGEEYREA